MELFITRTTWPTFSFYPVFFLLLSFLCAYWKRSVKDSCEFRHMGEGTNRAVHARTNIFTLILNFTFPEQLFDASSCNSGGHFKLNLLPYEIRQLYNFAFPSFCRPQGRTTCEKKIQLHKMVPLDRLCLIRISKEDSRWSKGVDDSDSWILLL
jgi:hypothetical protein